MDIELEDDRVKSYACAWEKCEARSREDSASEKRVQVSVQTFMLEGWNEPRPKLIIELRF